MKNEFIILGVLCLQVVFGGITEEDVPPSFRECLKLNSITVEEFASNLNEDFTVTEGVPKYNDVVLCAYRKDNYVNADDTLDNVKFHNNLVKDLMKSENANPEEAATNAIDACKSVEGSDPGDTLVKNYNCVMKYLKKL